MDFDHGNGSNKYSRTDIEESDGSGNSKHSSEESGSNEHSRRHLEFGVESRSSKHSDNCPEVINWSAGIESDHFEINQEIIKRWGNNNNFETHPELIDGSESSKRSEVIQEEIDGIEGDIPSSTEKLRLSSSSSSSSSGSSRDDQLQVDTKLSKSRSGITSTSSPKHDDDTQQSPKDKHHVSSSNSSKSEECQYGSAGPASTSQFSSITHESTLTLSPPIQEMDRLGEFDPRRIPSAVFARSKSTTPADWSIASNESLFSIQVGNNSFCRDHTLSLKSGELFKSGEFIAFSPPIAPLVDADKNSIELDKSETTLVSDNAVKGKTGPCAEEPIGEKPTHPVVSWNSSISNSVNSITSARSFAFPIRNKKKKKKKKKKKQKQKKCAWPSCYCSNCSWAFCYCRWPSCYCSSCSCAFCYGWNCSIKRWCCHFFTVLSDGRNLSKKEKTEQQQQQQQQQEQPLAAPSKSACCNCWSWFPSCRWKWHWQWCSCLNCCRGNCC